ncbi:MAG TPA: hypothetical protein VFZ78_05895 [Flavisolibacter sp.]
MKKLFPIAIFLVFLAGCGLMTMHPIFTPDELLTDSRMGGAWQSQDKKVVFAPASTIRISDIPEKLRLYRDRFYVCSRYGDDGELDRRSLAFLVRIGPHLYMDEFPLDTPAEQGLDDFFQQHQLKRHTISRVDFENGNKTLVWRGFKDDFVEDLIKKRQVRIEHTYIRTDDGEGELLITASTKDLQAFLLKYGSRSDAYESDENIYYTKTK